MRPDARPLQGRPWTGRILSISFFWKEISSMKKRLTAWLLVFCMALSLLPGTAFAAEGGGDDGKITITYNLNDGRTDYELQLKTDPGKVPDNEPGAVWAGRPFDGWTNDEDGNIQADYSTSRTLYAQWLDGYTVYLDFGNVEVSIPGFTPEGSSYKYKFITENSGKLPADTVKGIQDAIDHVNSLGSVSFDGWYKDKDTFQKPFDITGTFEGMNGETVFAKWVPTYKLTFKYNNPVLNGQTYNGETTTGGVMRDPANLPTPEYPNDLYSFDGWYIIEKTANTLPNADIIRKGNLAGTPGNEVRGIKIDNLSTYRFDNIAEYVLDSTNTNTITIEANWTAPYGIVFDANGGKFADGKSATTIPEATDKDGKLQKLPTANPTWDGYRFVEWCYGPLDTTGDPLNPTGDVVSISDTFELPPDCTDKDKDKYTVYAKWEKQIKITIAYGNGNLDDVELYVTPTSTDTDSTKPKYYAFSDDDIKKYFQNIKVPGYTVPEKVTVSPMPESTDTSLPPATTPPATPTEVTLNQIKTLKFTSAGGPYVIGATLVPGYFITLDPNGGEITGTTTSLQTDTNGYIKVDDLEVITATYPDDAKKFLGWSTSKTSYVPIPIKDVSEGTGTVKCYVFTDTDTIYAAWGAPYMITYEGNGGTWPSSTGTDTTTIQKKTAEGGKYDFPDNPTYPSSARAFDGWYTEKNGGTKITDTSTATEPGTLYARWKNHTITFDATGGTLTSPQTVTADDNGKIKRPAQPTRDMFNFAGWSTNPAATSAELTDDVHFANKIFDKDTTLYAVWTPVSTTPPNPAPPVTTSATPQKAPAKPSVAMANGGTPVLTALPTPPFNITFKFNTPTGATPPTGSEVTIETGDDGKLPNLPEKDPEITGYEFKGWYLTPSGEGPVSTSTLFEDKTDVYAYWQPVITFDANGGLLTGSRFVVTTDNKIPADSWPTATRKDHTFTGWYDAPTGGTLVVAGPSPTKPFTAPDTLYAHWEPNKYTITFDLNFDGAPALPTQQTTGTVTETECPTYSRPGYTLLGWYTEKIGGEKVTDYSFDSDKTVYAHWAATITITLDYKNGTGKTEELKVVGGNLDSSTPFPADTTIQGQYGPRKFLGWFTEEEGGVRYTEHADFSQPPFDKNITLYAHWDNSEVKVTFRDTETGTNVTMDTKNGGKLTSFPELPRVSGKKFVGWKLGNDYVTLDQIYTTDTTLTGEWISSGDVNPDGKPVVTFYIDIPPMPTDDAGQSEVAHFTMVANSSGDRLSQLPVLVGATKFNGWHEKGANEPVKLSKVYNGDTNLYVSLSQTYQITLDWNNGDADKVSDKVFVYTGPDGKIAAADWPDPDTEGKRPERPGCYFDNWYTAATGGEVVPKSQTFTAPTVIYAHWKSPYTITFDANGGTFPDGEEKIETETDIAGSFERAKIPADPSRTGYLKFGGWAISADGSGGAVDPATYKQPYTDPMTFYAIWGPPYAIEYDVMGGDELTPTDAQKVTTEDGKYPELPTPTRENYSFGGWYTTKDYQDGTLATSGGDCPGAVTLYAKWTREPPYTITFEANNADATMEDPASGQPVATITLKTDDKGVLMQAPPEPTLRGGKFQGWYTKAEEGAGELISDAATRTYTDDMTLYAHWETREFTITFDFNLGAIMSNPLTITTFTTTKGKSLTFLPDTLPQAASGNYKIKGWYRVQNPVEGKDQPVTTSSTFDRDTTLYAQWELAADLPITFKYPNVTFLDAENGNALVTLEVDKDYKMSSVPPGPYKEGQTFSGWFYREPDRPDGEEKQFTKDTEVTGSLRVYPKYVGAGFTITFEPGEESELEPIKVKTTSEGRIPDGEMPSPTWEGHTFTGWFTAAEGGTKINRRTVFTQDTTVYAHWDKDDSSEPGGPDDPGEDKPGPTSPPYTITFNPNGGNLNASTTALTDLNGRLMSLPTPARTGYSFDGWFNGSERITTATVFTANTTIMAQWSTGSGGSGGNGSGDINGYAITVSNTSGGRVSVSTTYAREGDRVTVTVRPYSGYQLDRIEVTNARGYDVDLRDQGSNRYVFYMPASRVTVDAVFMELIANNGNGGNTGNTGSTGGNTGGNTNWNPGGTVTQPSGGASSGMGIFSQPVLNTVPMPYLDVHPSDWYYSSVDYMWQRQLMGGVSNNRFGPQATTSNAMVWTILARLAGVDVTSGASVWYENARSWAVSNRISDGVGPNSAVTREQLATMLWNFKGSPAVGYDLGQFGDRGQISTYQAECALSWAVANNIVTGTANRLNPRGTATRAEVAAMITRFCQNT